MERGNYIVFAILVQAFLVAGTSVCRREYSCEVCLNTPGCTFVLAQTNDGMESTFFCSNGSDQAQGMLTYAKFRSTADCSKIGDVTDSPTHDACNVSDCENIARAEDQTAKEQWEDVGGRLKEACPQATPMMIALFVVILLLAVVVSVVCTVVFWAIREKGYDSDDIHPPTDTNRELDTRTLKPSKA